MSNPAGLRSPVSGANGEETETAVPPRMTMPELLHRPFDIRSFALTGLFILALFYTIYFARAVLLPVVLAVLLSFLFAPLVRAFAKIHIAPAVSAALLLLSVIAILVYGISRLAVPAAGWLEKAPYGLQELQHKLLPLKKPMEQVAQASGAIENIASPTN